MAALAHRLDTVYVDPFGGHIARCSCGVRSGQWSDGLSAESAWVEHATNPAVPSAARQRNQQRIIDQLIAEQRADMRDRIGSRWVGQSTRLLRGDATPTLIWDLFVDPFADPTGEAAVSA